MFTENNYLILEGAYSFWPNISKIHNLNTYFILNIFVFANISSFVLNFFDKIFPYSKPED